MWWGSANWTQQAIPLAAGKHHLRVEYRPASFVLGKWVTIVSIVLFAILGALRVWGLKRAARA